MKIAVTSQNFRTITGHAGKARRFLIYDAAPGGAIVEVTRLDLPIEQSFHAFQGDAHPVDGVDALITAGCGEGFIRKLAARGIAVIATSEPDPLKAVDAVAHGWPLPPPAPHH